jgi:hypothetical protein
LEIVMLDTESAPPPSSLGCVSNSSDALTQIALSRPRADQPTVFAPYSPTASRAEQLISGFSRAMGPVGLLSCLYITGWWVLHLL